MEFFGLNVAAETLDNLERSRIAMRTGSDNLPEQKRMPMAVCEDLV